MGDAFLTLWAIYGAIEMKLQFFFPKIESFKSKGSISGYKEWSDWEETSVGDIP